MIHKSLKIILLILLGLELSAQKSTVISLEEAHTIAEKNNRLIKILEYKVKQAEGKLAEMKSNFYPRLSASGTIAYNSDPNIYVYKGEFNHIYRDLVDIEWIDELLEKYIPLPPKDMTLIHGDHYLYKTSVNLIQPITQLTQVNSGKKVAETDVSIEALEKQKAINEIKLGITELYYGILLEQKMEAATLTRLKYKRSEYRDALNASEEGELLKVDAMGLKAEINETEHQLIKHQNQQQNYLLKLKQLLGVEYPVEPVMNLDSLYLTEPEPMNEFITAVSGENFSIQQAGLMVRKAEFGVDAARKEYIPGLALFGQYNYNHGIPLTPRSYFLTGLNLEWEIFASGERAAVIRQREALLGEATEDFSYQKESMRNEAEQLYLQTQNAKRLFTAAQDAYDARQEEHRLMKDAFEAGQKLKTDLLKSEADLAESEAELLASRVNYLILLSKMQYLKGN